MSESKKSVEQIEQERLTRRQALRRFGFGAGMSAILLLGADDLARMVGERMRQMDGDNRTADQIAKEFRGAGIALAGSGGGITPVGCTFVGCQASRGCSDSGDCIGHCEYNQCMAICYCYTQYPNAVDSSCQPIGNDPGLTACIATANLNEDKCAQKC